MSNEIITANSNNTVAFGRLLQLDTLNIITQVDNDTVVITPRYNTAGLTELKVLLYNQNIVHVN